jgi:hypothetical protein
VDTPGDALGVTVTGSYAFLVGHYGPYENFGTLTVLDVKNPESPQVLGSQVMPGWARDIIVSGGYAYVVSNSIRYQTYNGGLQVFDVTDPEYPRIIGSAGTPTMPFDAAVWGNCVYIADGFTGLQILPIQCTEALDRLDISIDVKPGNDGNRIQCGPQVRGVVPVSVLTTPRFDALTIDHTTILFGPGQAIEACSNNHGLKRHEEDVDGDGDLDLLFHFRLAETGIQCGDTEVTLTGMTYHGQSIMGTDVIQTMWKGDKGLSFDKTIRITPNPFNPQTKISFYADQPQRVRVAVYDIRGRRIAELTDQQYQVGEHSVEWRGRDSSGRAVPSGEYFFRIDIGGRVETRKAMLLR